VQSAIEYRERIYLNFDQGFSSINKLICLDGNTGDEVWRMDDDFTPAGIKNPIMVGKYYIGGAFQHAAAYDVETREFTWRYQDKASRFGAGLWAVGEWLISRDLVPTNKLHVFCVDP
jgi:outer membrane protein assembly factor BamB